MTFVSVCRMVLFSTSLGLAALHALPVGGAAQAATITITKPEEANSARSNECLLEGVIGRDDVAKVADAISQNNCVLVLNSPGGSLAAALDIVKAVGEYTPTLIRKGHKCLSACAVIFMAGSFSEDGAYAHRTLEKGGTLGFHRPSLDLPENSQQYQADDVVRAYDFSVIGVAEIANLSKVRYANRSDSFGVLFPIDLLVKMLKTEKDQMFYIDDVGRLLLSGVDFEKRFDLTSPDLSERNACDNYYWVTVENFDETTSTSGARYAPELMGSVPEFGISKTVIDGETFTRFADYQGAEGTLMTCTVRATEYGYELMLDEGPKLYLSVAYGLPRTMKLADVRLETGTTPQQATGPRCSVWSDGRETDNEKCHISDEDGARVGKPGAAIRYFVWPSGGKTVLMTQSGRMTLNGADAIAAPSVNGATCLKNLKTGNVFCYRQ